MMELHCDSVEGYDYKQSTMSENRNLLYAFTVLTEPELIVELGTYYGASYFAFAQAILDEDMKCDLFGVDTWEGDVHTGFYSQEVFDHFTKVIADQYNKDERLKFYQAPFDWAVDRFQDNSINVLMIDGNHSYQSSRHDFETWLPKLKNNGTVFFHDIAHNKFGVHAYWEELRAMYPHFEIKNENGLGMLFPKGTVTYNRLYRDSFYRHHVKKPKKTDARIGIYTAIYGDYDVPQHQVVQTVDADMLLFTDTEFGRVINNWHVVNKDVDEDTPRMKAKWWKVQPHHAQVLGNYDFTIYMDGHVKIKRPAFAQWAVDLVKDGGMAVFKHPDRDCVWDEYQACIDQGKFTDGDPPEKYLNHLERLEYPKHNGLYAGTVIIRNMQDPRVKEFGELWWDAIKRWSYRDQLTLPYVLWKMDMKPVIINQSLWDNQFIQYQKHANTHPLRD